MEDSMKRYLLPLAAAALSVSLFAPALAFAAYDGNFEKDAAYAEGTPPMVPHRMEPNATGEACLVCHLEGKNGAPITPHATRLDCVQCHVQGEIKEKRKATKKKKQQKEAE
jgi:nitrate reductase (cytochrome), electron transfer subunit